jgi:hypothetical protein
MHSAAREIKIILTGVKMPILFTGTSLVSVPAVDMPSQPVWRETRSAASVYDRLV